MRFHLLAFLSACLPCLTLASTEEQLVFPNPSLPGMINDVTPESLPFVQAQPRLSDLLTIESSASIFYSYARETEMSQLFSNEGVKTTLLVPTNKAVMALARKPHQGPAPLEDDMEISEKEYDERSKKNVERWISAHIIPQSPISLGSSHTYDTLLSGKSVSFKEIRNDDAEAPEWARVVLEDDIRIIGMKEAMNGVFYLIDGTVRID
ncbi:hypothetical protein JAAARDRAFT_28872 [Jaapia argillacea MUCL 33604]|uniref:FAS1 domain-containing protein n=1 Tax=Jaapia argillacea MUCL 33604 TaxID=933084 RepID=A0A067QHB0_9AGAM|nr:hypothetical protein JAAARDRAFT_28872 [Jaapia argillacea MUCL 33604]